MKTQNILLTTYEFEALFIDQPSQFSPIPWLMSLPLSVLAGYTYLAVGIGVRQSDSKGSVSLQWLGLVSAVITFIAAAVKLAAEMKAAG